MHSCPFHSGASGVSLSEIAGIVRCADRTRMQNALDQLVRGVLATQDLDEAKGEALTFIAVVTAATLELGGDRRMHRVQLDAARRLDTLTNHQEVAEVAAAITHEVAAALFAPLPNPSHILVERALGILNDKFMEDIDDDVIAARLGLSTSHFRHLFREVTGTPFSKYLSSLRLEKAKEMIVEDSFISINEVATACGFSAASHFTRAFSARFSVSPTEMRRGSLAVQVNG
jgi:AraC-like DNA-binding protein